MGYYQAGDYYMAGDPFLGGLVKGLGKLGKGFFKRTIGNPGILAQIPGVGPIGAVGLAVGKRIVGGGGRQQSAFAGVTASSNGQCKLNKDGTPRQRNRDGSCRKTPTMNPINFKALKKATRRQSAFLKAARRGLKGSGYTVVSRGQRRTSARRRCR